MGNRDGDRYVQRKWICMIGCASWCVRDWYRLMPKAGFDTDSNKSLAAIASSQPVGPYVDKQHVEARVFLVRSGFQSGLNPITYRC